MDAIVEQMFDALEVLISKDCAYCALVDPVLRYIVSKGYVKLIQRREFLDKQAYIKEIETIAKKYQQKRSFPLILVHHEGKERTKSTSTRTKRYVYVNHCLKIR